MNLDALCPGLLRLERLSDATLVPFKARRLKSPRLVWLNERWLNELGIGPLGSESKAAVERWILETFAVSVPYPPHDPCIDYLNEEVVVFADRYGATSGAAHGGSGRCATIGGFNVKGIGRTPLVASETDWYHSHGCMWLEEAIREAIYSEFARKEFPLGAVPTLAVIDTGTNIYWDDHSTGERRGLIVRPNFVRIAHFQRSMFFGTAGFVGSDQHLDAVRVQQMIRAVWGRTPGAEGTDFASMTILDSALRYSRQQAFAHFHRLWPGPFYSSNQEVDGKLVDFGSFRSVPDWRRRKGEMRAPAMGEESQFASACYTSLLPLLSKHGIRSMEATQLIAAMQSRYSRAMQEECVRALGSALQEFPMAMRTVSAALLEAYREEQARPVLAADDVVDDDQNCQDPAVSKALVELAKAQEEGRISLGAYRKTAYRLIRLMDPRSGVARETLLKKTLRLCRRNHLDTAKFPMLVARHIDRHIGNSLRIWQDLPDSVWVVKQMSSSDLAVAVCQHLENNSWFAWIEVPRVGESVVFAQSRLEISDIALANLSTNSSYFRTIIPLRELPECRLDIAFGEHTVSIRRFHKDYRSSTLRCELDGADPMRRT